MAFVAVLFLLFIVIIAQSEANTFITVECKTGNVGQYGHQSVLDCVVKTTQDVKDAKIQVATWKKKDAQSNFLTFNENKMNTKPGFRFAEPSWNERNMNVSLLIANTKLEDAGVYECMVMTDSGDYTTYTNLTVTAKYNKPIIHSSPAEVDRDKGATLFCNSDGGYPKGQLRWFDEHGVEWPATNSQVEKTSSGLFNLTSKLSLMNVFSKYTCKVFNATGIKDDESTLEIVEKAQPAGQESKSGLDEPTKIVAPVVVIGSLIVGLLLAVLVYRRRSQSDHRDCHTLESVHGEDEHLNKSDDRE